VKSDLPICEKEIVGKCTVGKEVPRELEESWNLQAVLSKVLVRAGWTVRVVKIHTKWD
jgi:hypothetical protein